MEIRGLKFRYHQKQDYILNGIDMRLLPGRLIVITGPNGSGKTTLLRCMSGIIPHRIKGEMEGSIMLPGRGREAGFADFITRVGMVFQEPENQLFMPTVEAELAFGPENLGVKRGEIEERVERWLNLLGLDGLRLAHPHHLSPGQKKLVVLGAVLTMDPSIILLDEITAGLDRVSCERVVSLMGKLVAEGKTIVSVDHSLTTASGADEIYLLQGGRLWPVTAGEYAFWGEEDELP